MWGGISVDDECVTAYGEMQNGHRWLYIIFRIADDGKRIIIDHKAGHDKNYDDFVSALKEAETKKQCRCAVFEVNILQSDEEKGKRAFVNWIPDNASTKQKMVYVNSGGYLLRIMSDIHKEIRCTRKEELGMTELLERINNK